MNYIRRFAIKAAALLISAGLVFSHLGCTALAAQTAPVVQTEVGADQEAAERLTPVTIPEEAQVAENGNILSGVRIGGIDAPVPGMSFDTEAVVTTAGGVTWLLPVMWVDENKVPVGPIAGNQVYFPVIVFCLPYGTAMNPADGSRILLDEQTAALFGNRGILSVYDPEHHFTLILPGDLYLPGQPAGTETDGTVGSTVPVYTPSPATTTPEAPASDQSGDSQTDSLDYLVELYTSQSAKDAFADSMDELKDLVDIVINRIQPQAVNLLLDKFPAFKKGAENGEIGTEISLYVYYAKGDMDGKQEHKSASPNALAYVDGGMVTYTDDNTSQYCYMIGLNAKSFSVRDKQGNLVLNRGESEEYDPESKSSTLDDLDNTMTHELLHAIMDDYNRTGMEGVTSVAESQKDRENDPEARQLYQQTHFPAWFIEGTASTVENILQYRDDSFIEMRKDYNQLTEEGEAAIQDAFTGDIMFDVYVNSGFDKKYDKIYYDLEYADNTEVNHDDLLGSQYISGYLACLYLGKMAASRKFDQNAATVDPVTGKTTFSSEVIRGGLNQIFQDLHDGMTLDQEIQEISGGVYTSTDDFARRFIKGEYDDQNQVYVRDQASLTFCVDYLNYMESMAQGDQLANGSILFDFDKQYTTPLDRSQTASTQTLKIIEDNGSHASTVSNDTALAGGGKSRSGSEPAAAQQTKETAPAQEPQMLTFPEPQPAETSGQAARMPAAEAVAEEPAVMEPEAEAVAEEPAAMEPEAEVSETEVTETEEGQN